MTLKKWLLFGAGAAALVVGILMVMMAIAFALGGTSLVGFLLGCIHAQPSETPGTKSKVIHWARSYDLLVWVLTLGRDRVFREKTLDLAQVAPGESVLDIGCATGTLANRRQTSGGFVGQRYGNRRIAADDRSRPQEGATRGRRGYGCGCGRGEPSLRPARLKCIGEVRQALRPGGRFLALDFGAAAARRRTHAGRMHNHAHFDLLQLVAEFRAAGMSRLASG